MGVSVRAATLDDMAAILEMGRALHDESPRYAHLSFNEEKVFNLAHQVLTGPRGGAFVAEKDGRIVGMVAGYVIEHWFSDDVIASDYTFYVWPAHRGGRAALLLWREFEAWAKAHGAVDCVPGITTGINMESTARFFEHLGYARAGYTFFKRLANV